MASSLSACIKKNMKKNIYLANFSMTINPGEHRFLPYSVAGLWAYARLEPEVDANYNLAGIFFKQLTKRIDVT